jgi:hypothetical protein
MQYKKNKDNLFKELARVTAVSLVVLIVIAAVYYTSEKAMAQYATTANVCPIGVYPCNVPNPYTAYPYPYPYSPYPYPYSPYPYPYSPYPYPYSPYPYP